VKKEKFYIAVCIISFGGSWAKILNISVFSYFDGWFISGLIILGICFAALYINNKNDKTNGT
jgi:hypothetical protein